MPQYSIGTVTVTQDSNQVQGSAEVDWSFVLPGDIFTKNGTVVTYTIGACNPTTKVITLAGNYAGVSEAGIAYEISWEFSPQKNLPLPSPKDTNAVAIIRRALLAIDAFDTGYAYYAYASDDQGTGFTLTFNPALDYFAFLKSAVEIPTPVAGDFIGLWKNVRGAQGIQGIQGPTGPAWDQWRGAWVTATDYIIKDAVSNGGSSYICKSAHTSGSISEPGTGTNWQSYWGVIAEKGTASAADIAGAIHAAVSKAIPTDDDELGVADSAAAFGLKKFTWATIKSALLATWKDATGGLVGLTLFKINFINTANTFTSFFTNANTASRTYTFKDRDGVIADDTDLAGKANLSGFTAAGLVNLAAGANIASAATIDLTAATGNSPRITGTVPTSAVAMNAGQVMLVVADGAWPLTYNATTNKINTGGVNYTCTPGDVILYYKDFSGVVHGLIQQLAGTPERGTWTPTAVFSVSNGDVSYAVQVGLYTKIDRVYFCEFYLSFGETTASGDLSIGGIPAAANPTTAAHNAFNIRASGMAGITGQINGFLAAGGTTIAVEMSGTGNPSAITSTHTDDSCTFIGNFFYFT